MIIASRCIKEQGLKIALFFSLMVASIVLTVALGVNGSGVVVAGGLVAVTCFSFLFMDLFVELLRDLRR